jgi:hypothetical protein
MHRRTIIGTGLALPLAAAAAKGEGMTGEVDLSRDQLGPLPPEFLTTWRTGKGASGDWHAVAEPTAAQGKAIAQLNADATDYRFPLAVYEPLPAKNVEASVRFKAVSGRGDRAGGLAARLRDVDNYDLARANALEDSVRLYRVVKGDRQQLASASTKVSSGVWHTLSIRAESDRFTASFNGKPVLSHADHNFHWAGQGGVQDEDGDVPKARLDRQALAIYRNSAVQTESNRALRACAVFQGDVLIVQSEHDHTIPPPVITSHRNAFVLARSVTYRVIEGADHGSSEERWQQAYTSILVNWAREMVLGARESGTASEVHTDSAPPPRRGPPTLA